MESTEVVTMDDRWTVIHTLRTDYGEGDRASALQVRKAYTDNGHLTFSFRFGVLNQDETEGSVFQGYSYIPERYADNYIRLLTDARSKIRRAMQNTRDVSESGRVEPGVLEEEVERIFNGRGIDWSVVRGTR